MKVYILQYQYETWTDQSSEVLGIYLTKESAYASMMKEVVDRRWKDVGDEKTFKVTDTYVMYRPDWEVVKTLQIEEYEVKN